MSAVTVDRFVEFFKAVYQCDPFPWQIKLAQRVCEGDWPRAIALPTAAGKTACIDIALFALACRTKDAPRRIFFVVDRRIVVDQAYLHTKRLAKRLKDEKSGILNDVADVLRDIADPDWRTLTKADQVRIRPLDVYTLRGGMYRETAWTKSPLQPLVIASTVDQIGSRLLFRGYGVSDSMQPVHAGLIGNDALILLDEAHCAKPFDRTVQTVESYRKWNDPVAPFRSVSISATPSAGLTEEEIVRDSEEDRKHDVLGPRITASKPTLLVIAEKAKGKNGTTELVKVLETKASELANEFACVGVIVNRVKTARQLYRSMMAEFGDDVVLLTGRMRPLDRDKLFDEKLKPLLSNANGTPPRFIIGTQCLECGADFDFYALVTECASLDALRQRFGRLNRVARRPTAKAAVVIRADQVEPKEKESEQDPIYGNSLAHTWKFLRGETEQNEFDFGIGAVRELLIGMPAEELAKLNAPTSEAPTIFPAHLDCWVQTHPRPVPDPNPALFLHGPKQSGQPDVQVVIRRDLGDDSSKWADVVALCPPSSSEAVAVPIGIFQQWLAGTTVDDDQTGDVEGESIAAEEDVQESTPRVSLAWCGPVNSKIISGREHVRPNSVYVVPANAADISLLGDFPTPLTDHAEEAYQRSRDKVLLRLTESKLSDEEPDFEAMLMDEIEAMLKDDSPEWLKRTVEYFINPRLRRSWEIEPHPCGGWVAVGKKRLHRFDPTYLDDSEPALSYRGESVTLKDHSSGVAEYARRFAIGCGLDADLYSQAGLWHDLGKLDSRFQAMLKQCSPRTAVGVPLAKSEHAPLTPDERKEARQIHQYPAGGRHELLSAALVGTKSGDDLLLHLIATHHGSARPFADPVEENEMAKSPFKTPELFAETFELPSAAQQIADWNSELPERFWRVVRQYGWWGAAYREAVFRLADHAQSRDEQEGEAMPKEAIIPKSLKKHSHGIVFSSLSLPGLDGANPLGFLAALGTLVVCDGLMECTDKPNWLAGPIKLSWGDSWSPYSPVLHFPSEAPDQQEFADALMQRLALGIENHPSAWVIEMLELGFRKDAVRDFTVINRHAVPPVREYRRCLDWVTALSCESAIDADSQLQTVRCDYLIGNLRSIMQRTTAEHLFRSLFLPWDYADALDNQSLHWEPTEDRRHAYQWHMPSGDPTRKRRGGMLGANRVALEAWPLFPSFPAGDRVTTRGFKGNRSYDTFWTWPLWTAPATVPVIGSMLAAHSLQDGDISKSDLRQLGFANVFRLQRILVGKTPNFTTTTALA